MDKNDKIYVPGHTGLFGSAIVRALEKQGYTNIIKAAHKELDLTDEKSTYGFLLQEKPDYIFAAAAKVGGIHANRAYMADFAMDNLQITCNLIKAAHLNGVKKLLYLASSCIYPRNSAQPVKEEYLLTGIPEPTNEGYAIAKIAGARMCDYYKKQYGDNFVSCIPANVYGENDCFDVENNHVIPALLQRFDEARDRQMDSVEIWGTGTAEREFLYIDDAAEACIRVMDQYDGPGPINIGVGYTTTIKELAEAVKKVVGYEGAVRFDTSKPDGMPRRLLDSGKIYALGWRPHTSLEEGLRREYHWYLEHIKRGNKNVKYTINE